MTGFLSVELMLDTINPLSMVKDARREPERISGRLGLQPDSAGEINHV